MEKIILLGNGGHAKYVVDPMENVGMFERLDYIVVEVK